MKLFLPKLATSSEIVEMDFLIDKRLPPQATDPCQVHAVLKVHGKKEDYFRLDLSINGKLSIKCMRCMKTFDWLFDEAITVAVCDTEQKAEALMSEYECMVSHNYHIEPVDVITDSLNLMAPEIHPDLSACDLSDVKAYLSEYAE